MRQIPKTTNPDKKNTTSKFLNIQSLFLFLVFPLSQLINWLLVAQEMNALYNLPLPAIYTIIGGLLFFIILILYVLHKQYSKKQTTRSYRELLSMQQYQKKHYEAIQRQRNTLEHLKSNFNAQLNDIYTLLETDNQAEALDLLQSLTKEIAATKEYPFCPNPVINAILSDKERDCQEAGIAFHADMQIGACASMDKLHLCSIFSNLLDNALEASKKIEVPSDRYINLTARQSGDYLHIKVKNASLPPSSSPREGHGYGQKILRDIAEKYSGEFRTHYENHTYEALLSIQLP